MEESFFIVAGVSENLPSVFSACCDKDESQLFSDEDDALRLAAALTSKYKIEFAAYQCVCHVVARVEP